MPTPATRNQVILPARGLPPRIMERRPAVYLTFDDGFDGVYNLAFPYLAALGIPATAYIITDLVGTAGHMSAAQLVALDSAGWAVANHTTDHTLLDTLSEADQVTKISGATTALQGWGLGRCTMHLAYPAGNNNDNTLVAMARTGMLTGRTIVEGGVSLPLAGYNHRAASYLFHVSSNAAVLKGYIAARLAEGKSVTLYMHNVLASGATSGDLNYSQLTDMVEWLVTRSVPLRAIDQLPIDAPHDNTDWWNVPGQTCVAAYAAKGAADIDGSYVNLANPGTFDCTAPVAAPTFNTATGWTFNGSTQYLATGISGTQITTGDWSAAVRINALTGVGRSFGSAGVGPSEWNIYTGTSTYFGNGGNSGAQAAHTNGVLSFAGRTWFRNGVAGGTINTGPSYSALPAVMIGAWNSSGTVGQFINGTIQAMAFYSTTLTNAQMAWLAYRMNAL